METKTTGRDVLEGVKHAFWLPNTVRELASLRKTTKAVFGFILAGLAAYYVLLGDFTFWGNLSILGLVLSAINLSLVDEGKLTSFSWGIATSICSLVGAVAHQMYGDAAYYIWVLPWLVFGCGQWLALSKDSGEGTTQSRSVPKSDIWKYACLFASAYVVIYAISIAVGGTIPEIDSLVLAFGVVGQVFLSKSYRQQWYVWIAQDIVAIASWSYRVGLAVETGASVTYSLSMLIMWSMFLVNAVYGAYRWRKAAIAEADAKAKGMLTADAVRAGAGGGDLDGSSERRRIAAISGSNDRYQEDAPRAIDGVENKTAS